MSSTIAMPDKSYAIFDMDGTLIDSMPYWAQLPEEYLKSMGVKDIPPNLFEKISTQTATEAAQTFLDHFSNAFPESGIAETTLPDAKTITEGINALMAHHYAEDIPLKAHVVSYLDAWKEKGGRLCVASATAEPLIRLCLSRLDILSYFDFVLSTETLGIHKRDDRVFRMAAAKWDQSPENIAVYEDSLFALRSAKSGGFYTVAVHDHVQEPSWPALQEEADLAIYLD